VPAITYNYSGLFEDAILSRAYQYANVRHLKSLSVNLKMLSGVVVSTMEYVVHIALDNQQSIESMTCTCPYHGNCKHMAAILIYIDELYLNRLNASR